MQRVLPILSGAAFTVAVSTASGMVLLRRLRIPLDALEEALFAFVSGSACVSFVVLGLCLVHQARLPVFLAGGAAVLCGAAMTRPARRLPKPFPREKVFYLLLFAVCFVIYFFNALAPEVSPDGSGYHLGNVTRLWENFGFVWNYHSIYSYLSQGLEMLFLVAFSIGGMSAAAMVHFAFLCALALLVASYGRRFGFPATGMFAGLLVFASPVVGLVGVSAYNDVALATCLFAVFYLLQVLDETRSTNLLIVIGLLSGFAYGIKYTGWVAVPFAVIALRGRGMARFAPAAAVMAVPWMLRNWFWLHNPFAPFLNSWFPNPFYSAEAEASYLRDLRHLEAFRHWWEVPLDMTIYGAKLPGFLGPVFLLAPLALLALRHRQGRRLLTAAAVFSLPVALNPGARFLIPGLPFVALAMGVALQNSPGVLPALAAFHVLLGLPAMMPAYSAPWSWRLREVPARVALGLSPEAPYIEQYLPDYWLKAVVEPLVPKDQKILTFAGRPEAYIDRWIVVGYESAEGQRAVAAVSELQPRALEAMGIHFLLVNEGDFLAPHIQQNLNLLGLSLVAARNGTTFYRIH